MSLFGCGFYSVYVIVLFEFLILVFIFSLLFFYLLLLMFLASAKPLRREG